MQFKYYIFYAISASLDHVVHSKNLRVYFNDVRTIKFSVID